MDLRTLLGGPSEVQYDLDKEHVRRVDQARSELDYWASQIDELGRETGHVVFTQISATTRAASLGLSQVLTQIKAEERNRTLKLEGKEGGN